MIEGDLVTVKSVMDDYDSNLDKAMIKVKEDLAEWIRDIYSRVDIRFNSETLTRTVKGHFKDDLYYLAGFSGFEFKYLESIFDDFSEFSIGLPENAKSCLSFEYLDRPSFDLTIKPSVLIKIY